MLAFDILPDLHELKNVFQNMIEKYDRFRCIPDNPSQMWVEVDIDLNHHIKLVVVESDASIDRYIADNLLTVPLSQSKPLWDVTLLQVCFCLNYFKLETDSSLY